MNRIHECCAVRCTGGVNKGKVGILMRYINEDQAIVQWDTDHSDIIFTFNLEKIETEDDNGKAM